MFKMVEIDGVENQRAGAVEREGAVRLVGFHHEGACPQKSGARPRLSGACPYTGDGDYIFGPESFAKGTMDVGDIVTVQVGLGTEADGGGFLPFIVDEGPEWDAARYTAYTSGGRWLGGRPERPETELPEPAAYAYGVTGLVSACGIKRRIRK